ncbi:MAG: acyltransferase [Caldilineaceae bacterium]
MAIHPTVDLSPEATIGAECQIWHYTQIREGVAIGDQCIIGRNVYIDAHVRIGNRVKVQNGALLYQGAVIEDGVFIGPQACLTNDRYPRAITPCGQLKRAADWQQGVIHIQYGASIGAGAVIVTGVTIGRFAMVGAGAVVTRDVPDHALVVGTPAQVVGYVCACGYRFDPTEPTSYCAICGWGTTQIGDQERFQPRPAAQHRIAVTTR